MKLLVTLLCLLLLTGCGTPAASTEPPPTEPILPGIVSPSEAARQQSTAKAARLAETYGVQVLVYEDAAQVMPWDYALTPSTAPEDTNRTLDTLDSLLSLLPEGFLRQLSQGCGGLSLCLVDSIRGTAASGSLASAQGLQFRQENQCYVALAHAPAEELGYTLFHELSHLIDTQVMSSCSAYDSWQDLNPQGFVYGNQSGTYLTGSSRCFIDAYAMTSPSEDRARIFECAVNPGNETLFASPALQQKLQRVCTGIRQAFGLENAEECFLWEQYLAQ